MVNTTLSLEQMRNELAAALSPFDLDVDEFLSSDIDDYSDANLRDIWLMVKGILKPTA